jgi:hypothetical protein
MRQGKKAEVQPWRQPRAEHFRGRLSGSQTIACDSSAPVDGIEETASAGASGLSYDAATGRYVYVWKTDKSWAATCRQLTLKLVDETTHNANFMFR